MRDKYTQIYSFTFIQQNYFQNYFQDFSHLCQPGKHQLLGITIEETKKSDTCIDN